MLHIWESCFARNGSLLNVGFCRDARMTRKLHTCVGIIVSRMFLIVSMVPGGEVVLLFSLLPWLVVLYWLWVGCWSDSLPNIMNALPETLDIAVKNVTIPQQQHLGVFIELHSCLIQSWQMPPVLRCKSCIRGSPRPRPVWIWTA